MSTRQKSVMTGLCRKYNKGTWGNASVEEKAMARTLRVTMEEHFSWGMARWRFFEGIDAVPNLINIAGFKFMAMKWLVPGKVKSMLHAPRPRLYL